MKLLKLVPEGTHINFIGQRRIALGGSVIGIILSFVLLLTMGLNFGIDFRGGTSLILQTPEYTDVGVYRDAVSGLDLGEIQITEISASGGLEDKNQVLVRIVEQGGDQEIQAAAITAVRGAIAQAIPNSTVLSTESVGAKVSAELVQDGALAVLLAVLGVMVYVWLRFEWQFAVGAVLSLVHDVILTMGLFSVLQLEFGLAIVAAILTIIGYSLNDTVVVFDRVRENLRRYKKMPLPELVNLSVNETLSRTTMTSLTTLLALVALYVLGGDVIAGFTLAMIWGVLVGTYSSVYVAGIVLNWLGVDRSDKTDSKAGTQFANIDA